MLPQRVIYATQNYQFPVSERTDIREVVEPDFDILGKEDELYVDLSEVRSSDYLDEIKNQINIDEQNCLIKPVNVYPKILFSGYRGSGKTLEVRRLQKALNHSKGYITILVETESELEVSKFKPEDFFVFLVAKLVKRLVEDRIEFHSLALQDLQKEWLGEKEVAEEINRVSKDETEVNAGIGGDFLGLFKLGTSLKGLFASENKTSTTIRQKIERNKPQLIQRFNLILMEIRESLRKNPKVAKDILFIFDGSEKIKFETYENLFINEAQLITNINLNIIISVPIQTFFKVTHSNALNFYDYKLLPMLKPSPEVFEKMKEILQRRAIWTDIITDDAFQAVISYSGGSIRQMFKIMSVAIIGTRGKITMEYFEEKALAKLKNQMYESLTSEHKDILENKKFIDKKGMPNVADPNIWQLVDANILLKYNGKIAINPLIAEYFE
jgi:hypothetical protein